MRAPFRPAVASWLALGVLLAVPARAAAHDLLLDPSHDHLDARAVVSLKLFLGHAAEGKTVDPDREAATYVCITPDGKRHVPGGEEAGLGLFDATQAGVYVFAYATRPGLIHVPHEDLLEVVREAGAEPTHGRELAGARVVRPWRVEERHHAKAIVVVDGGEAGRVDRELGLGLELVPAERPDRLGKRRALTVRLLEAGVPVAKARVVAYPREAPTRELVATTDGAGRVTFSLPAAGAWAVRAVRLERAPRRSAAEWIVSRATLTCELPDERSPGGNAAPAAGTSGR